MQIENSRRYDLDWLRIIVFGLLIFYHVGMFFVPWGWHIKNNQIYEGLRWPMLFLNQWRLPILFVISGMGTAYALGKRTIWEFIKERNARLGIPLLFGMVVIIPPQVYIERLAYDHFTGNYFDFWINSAFQGIYPEGNFSWHHLWFLPYLLVFSILLSPILHYLQKNPSALLITWVNNHIKKNPYWIFWLILPLYLFESLLEPFFDVTHNLIWDWFNFISSMTLFWYGFLLISIRKTFWHAVLQIKRNTLIIGIICFLGQVLIWLFLEDGVVVHFSEALLKVTNIWAWILTLFGFGSAYLNRPSRALAYANRAVYPFYILHQTITVILGYFIYQSGWGLLPKALFLVTGTFGISFLIYELIIRRIALIQPLFGVKKIARKET